MLLFWLLFAAEDSPLEDLVYRSLDDSTKLGFIEVVGLEELIVLTDDGSLSLSLSLSKSCESKCTALELVLRDLCELVLPVNVSAS